MRPLTLLQRQKITLSLFFTVAVGAVVTVATPAFVPWEVVDEKRAQALDQQRRQGKDFHVIEDRRQRNSQQPDSTTSTHNNTTDPIQTQSNHSSVTTLSSQGPLISLLTDRSQSSNQIKESSSEEIQAVESTSELGTTTKKRRRRRKRKMVNEGWQEFTGRTAREEKERQEQSHQTNTGSSSSSGSDSPVIGENGGVEINWKNKSL